MESTPLLSVVRACFLYVRSCFEGIVLSSLRSLVDGASFFLDTLVGNILRHVWVVLHKMKIVPARRAQSTRGAAFPLLFSLG